MASPEFFQGSAVKTPERYKRIRNGLVEMWRKQRPRYLSKTAARKQLKDCGDVNVIGRVHEALERMGAINFGAEAGDSVPRPPAVPRPPKPAAPRVKPTTESAPSSALSRYVLWKT